MTGKSIAAHTLGVAASQVGKALLRGMKLLLRKDSCRRKVPAGIEKPPARGAASALVGRRFEMQWSLGSDAFSDTGRGWLEHRQGQARD